MTKKPEPKRRPTIGENPLGFYIQANAAATHASRRKLAPLGSTAPEPEKPKRARRSAKVRATFHLPPDLLQELRDSVVGVRQSGKPVYTMAALAEEAFRREVERLRKAHNGGKPFPHFDGVLDGGRPIGS